MSNTRPNSGRAASLIGYLRRHFFRGLTISLPILITVIVFFFMVDFIAGLLDPAVFLIQQTVGYSERIPDTAIAGLALALLMLVVLLVGIAAESRYGSGGIERHLENAMANVPGFSSIYTSINELSTMLMDSDTQSFREVKVIEYPYEGTYALGFLTAGSTGVVSEATGEDRMMTIFLPMAPNPMGGFLIHLPAERVYDVDLTVEEGVQTVLSTGVTLEDETVIDTETTSDEVDDAVADEYGG